MADRAHPLEIPEIVALVCCQLANTPAAMRDLAALARTAKIFQDGALNGIWQWQDTFAHILRLMPHDLWNMSVEDKCINMLELARPIAAADWERPLFYLHRVKTLKASESGHLPSPELFENLHSACPREHLFPNLCCLTWTHDQWPSPALYSCICAVLGPRLNQLVFDIPFLASDLSIFPTIAVKCPELTDVDIGGTTWNVNDDYRKQLRTSVSLLLRGLTYIQNLYLADKSSVDESAFEHLATTCPLKSLRLGGFHRDDIGFRFFQPSEVPRFTHLASLSVLSISVVAASEIVSCRPPLADIDLGIYPAAGNHAISNLYRTMAENIPSLTLRSLILLDMEQDSAFSSVPRVLLPLLVFHNLTMLKLDNDCGFALDDDIVVQIACAWPCLQSLNLISNCRQADLGPPRVTLAALCIFAQHCPALRLLRIDMSALTIPALVDVDCVHPALFSLLVGYAPIENPAAVADFIFAVCPNMTDVRHGSGASLGEEDRWELCQRWEAVSSTLAQKRSMMRLAVG
ncbi:hypothetical protein DFH06DRAFT_1470863 [Mycena polygramma]|nr:hypothetical protein DFH06DRAFT_1470863 [Mycena polygramma]